MDNIINIYKLYNYHFAYGFHHISSIFGQIIEFNIKSGETLGLEAHIRRLIDSDIEENLNSGGKLLLFTNYETKLLEKCLNCRDHSIRLDLIFELRNRGGTFFNIEIEEYILSREDFYKKIYMLERYCDETGMGYKLYDRFLSEIPQKRSEIIKSISKIGLINLKEKIEEFSDINNEKFIIDALFCMEVFDAKYASELIKKYIIKYKDNENIIEKLIDDFIEFLLIFDGKKYKFSFEVIEFFIKDLITICGIFKKRKCFNLLYLGVKYPTTNILKFLSEKIPKDDEKISVLFKLLESKLNKKSMEFIGIDKLKEFSSRGRELLYNHFLNSDTVLENSKVVELMEFESNKMNIKLLEILLKFVIENKAYSIIEENYLKIINIYKKISVYKENFKVISMILFLLFKVNHLNKDCLDRLFKKS
jgi:hypothetical protein